jgi:RNA polymerase sigma factor (sigma-70 family)
VDQLEIAQERLGDAELISAVRMGDDDEATSELFRRHHAAALNFATALATPSLAADLVADSFEKVLTIIRRGRGPELAFRAYLLTTIRRAHVDHIRRTRLEVPVDDVEDAVSRSHVVEGDGVDERLEAQTILRAYRSLPQRWQTVLWHTAVENEPLDQVAEVLGMNANSVAALSFRAREGLRGAYLAEHLACTEEPECRAVIDQMVKYVRGVLPPRQSEQVSVHVPGCLACTAALADLKSINSNLGAILAPAILGGPLSEKFIAHLTKPASNVRSWGLSLGIMAALSLTALLAFAAVTAHPTPRAVQQPDTPFVANQSTEVPPTGFATPIPKPTSLQEPTPIRTVSPITLVPLEPPSPSPVAVTSPTTSSPTSFAHQPLPTTTPTGQIVADVALGAPSRQQLTTGEASWFHIQFPVTGSAPGLVIKARLTGISQYQLHSEHEYGLWHCSETILSSLARVMTCTLTIQPGRSSLFALDVVPDGGEPSTASVEALVRLTSGRDPNPDNNRAAIDFPAPAP